VSRNKKPVSALETSLTLMVVALAMANLDRMNWRGT
jgi:hypothetical protein